MKKRHFFVIAIIVILTVAVAYFYLNNYYFINQRSEYKVYTAEDFPNSLSLMGQDVLEASLTDLNKQYEKLNDVTDKYTYIRWINIGIIKKRFNDYAGTEEAWKKAIEYNPDQGLAYGNLADMYLFDLGEYEKAEEYYKKVLSMRTDNFNYYYGLAALYRYNMTEKADEIEGLMISGAENTPSEAENYYMYLADYFYREGKDVEKSKYYSQKTLELNSSLKDQLPDYNE
ncbi:tetratricopeptide repeat protein [Patescibacteria group bacterium]